MAKLAFSRRPSVRSDCFLDLECVPFLVSFVSLLWREIRDPTFSEGRRFLLLMVGEVGSYFEKWDLFPLCITAFQIGALLRVPSYFVEGDEVSS